MAIFKFKNENGQWETIDCLGAVKYVQQTLTEIEKAQARENIGVNPVIVEVLFSGNATTAKIADDKAWTDYEMVLICWGDSGGGPAEGSLYSPKYGAAVSLVNTVGLTGTQCQASITGLNSSTKGGSLGLVTMGTYPIPKFQKIIGFKFS